MIYDCFTFFNELDILELRLNTLHHVVDKFVLVEATKTHSNVDKELHYLKNKERFSKFEDKIIHLVVEEFPEVLNSWTIENYQRNFILKGLEDCASDDLILISDVDEIPRPELIVDLVIDNSIHCFVQELSYFFFNYKDLNHLYWIGGTRALKYRTISELRYSETLVRYNDDTFPKALNVGLTPTKIRLYEDCIYIYNGGWHFSYLGGVKTILSKVKAFAHQELNNDEFLSISRLERCLNTGEDVFGRPGHKFTAVPIDKSFPSDLQEKLSDYERFVWPHQGLSKEYLFQRRYQLARIKVKLFVKRKLLFPVSLLRRCYMYIADGTSR